MSRPLQNNPAALPRVLTAVDWTNAVEVAEMHQLLLRWEKLDPLAAMELLNPRFPDSMVRGRWVVPRCPPVLGCPDA